MRLVVWDQKKELKYINNPPEINVEIGALTVHISIHMYGEVAVEIYRNPYSGGDPVDTAFAKQK